MTVRTAPFARRHLTAVAAAALSAAALSAAARSAGAASLGDVFVIDLENHNWTQPDGNVVNAAGTGGTTATGIQQIRNNPAAPFINSLVTPGNANAAQASYTNSYYNVLATPTGNNASIHPSEPNYVWQESGSNLGVTNDNDPYAASAGSVGVIQNYLAANPSASGQNLSALLQNAGVTWKSYQEGTDLLTGNGGNVNNTATSGTNTLTNAVAAPGQFTVPLKSFSGTSATYTNPYNGSHQYNFATKHDGTLFFPATNGGNDPTAANVMAGHYAPLEQLQSDLTSNTVGRYDLITPDQYNDMHTQLSGGFTYNGVHYAGDAAQIAQGDNFLSKIVPAIEASAAYQNNGAIVIWTDETEQDSTGGSQNDYRHTLLEIVISPLAKGNAYQSVAVYTHSSDVATLQDVFQVPAATPTGYLNDAGSAGTASFADLFAPGTIPNAVPEPASLAVVGLAAAAAFGRRRRA